MNIVLATDHNYFVHCLTTIMSIVYNNGPVNFFVLTDGLPQDDITKLKNVVSINNSSCSIVRVNPNLFRSFPMPDKTCISHISLAAYYRLFVSLLLPKYVDKVIYLDSDIIVRKSLLSLWNLDIDGFSLGAVYQNALWNNDRAKELGYPIEYGYFNSGVLLINVNYWRQHNIYEKFIEYLKVFRDKILYHDQDVLNAVLYDTCIRLEARWNMLNGMFQKDYLNTNEYDDKGNLLRDHFDYKQQILTEYKDPTIIHYVSKPKAWDPKCKHPWKREYMKYRKMFDLNYHDSFREKFYYFLYKMIIKLGISPYLY